MYDERVTKYKRNCILLFLSQKKIKSKCGGFEMWNKGKRVRILEEMKKRKPCVTIFFSSLEMENATLMTSRRRKRKRRRMKREKRRRRKRWRFTPVPKKGEAVCFLFRKKDKLDDDECDDIARKICLTKREMIAANQVTIFELRRSKEDFLRVLNSVWILEIALNTLNV